MLTMRTTAELTKLVGDGDKGSDKHSSSQQSWAGYSARLFLKQCNTL